MPEKNSDIVREKFVSYLESRGLSLASHKNYRSDLVHFMGWVILKIRSIGAYVESLTEIVPFLNSGTGSEYKSYMIGNHIPVKTINRRLSTLRHLSHFLFSSDYLEADFMKSVENVSGSIGRKSAINPIVNDFQIYLEAQKISKNTIKNYISDIHQFLRWVESVNSSTLKN